MANFPTASAVYGIITGVLYALRKLIAFVFLGGMFWFIYQDLGNIDQPWFMHALGLITIAFASFWLLIPMAVVWCRIRRRRAQNMARYRKWLDEGGLANIRPLSDKNVKFMAVGSDERIFSHEKGTLYASSRFPGIDVTARHVGRPSDVAFPENQHDFYVCQRTHCYITNRRVAFDGKGLDADVPFDELKSFSVAPGGIVFVLADSVLLFTFQNPLVAADVLRFARDS